MSTVSKVSSKSSLIDSLKELPAEELNDFILNEFSEGQAYELLYDSWEAWARDKQLPPPGDWATWLILAGRGWGKNRTAVEYLRAAVEEDRARKLLLVSKNPQDAREDMIEEERSGILALSRPDYMPEWQPYNRRLVWPDGKIAHIRTGAKPQNIRGGGYDLIWMDEIAAWDYPQRTYDNIQFACRRGDPREIITTTPKPLKLLEQIKESAEEKPDDVVLTEGITHENRRNLSDKFFRKVIEPYEGTRLGKQEIHAQILTETPGALWNHKIIQYIDREEVIKDGVPINFDKVCVGVDPATTNKASSDETGIIVAGKRGKIYVVLADYSGKYSPHGWASTAVKAYHTWYADKIVAEANQGGDMVKTMIKDVESDIPFQKTHGARGKSPRAEPIASLYEQGKVYHVKNMDDPEEFEELERQYTTWEPGADSPDRLDAAVWALRWLKGDLKKYTGGSWRS